MHCATDHDSGEGCHVNRVSLSGATSASASAESCSNRARKWSISGASAIGPETAMEQRS
jgi:hypothetical protein